MITEWFHFSVLLLQFVALSRADVLSDRARLRAPCLAWLRFIMQRNQIIT